MDRRYVQLLAVTCMLMWSFSSASLAQKASLNADGYPIRKILDLPDAGRGKVESAIKRLLSTEPPANRSDSELGWDCFAAAALVEAGEGRAKRRLLSIAEQLSGLALRSEGKTRGWRFEAGQCANGGFDAFGDGTCNSADTAYSFNTGLGLACLAKAGALLENKDFTAEAKQILSYWQEHTLSVKLCSDCIYYAFSDSPYDEGRYVRNVNVFMAYAAAVLGAATGDQTKTELANRAMRSELNERQTGNKGYLGRLDQLWVANRANASQNIENHAAAVAVLSDQIGILAGSQAFREHGLAVWRDWATCDNKQCRTATCKAWGGDATKCQTTLTAAHCAFRKRDALADSQCREYLSRTGSIPSFGIWSAIVGGGVDQ